MTTGIEPLELTRIAREAYLYTMPLLALEGFRRRRMAAGGMHRLLHARKLLNHRSRAITTPNNDTLYTDFWLDLRKGPVRVQLPAAGRRYLSLALMDAYTNNFAVLGTRTTGPDAVDFTIIGPDDPAGGVEGHVIRAPTPDILGLARILVESPDDLQAAREVQEAITLSAPEPDEEETPFIGRDAPWPDYFREAARLMKRNPPPMTDLAQLRRIARLGLGRGEGFEAAAFTASEQEAISAGVAEARAFLAQGLGAIEREQQGWATPHAKFGDFGQNYAVRAAVAVGGLAALPLEEATYFSIGPRQNPELAGHKSWKLHFPADRMIPTDGFWSLSIYEQTENGEYFFTDNPLRRYAIGDRTPGLRFNEDGSLDIWISSTSPGPERECNWLPAPPGPFCLFLRAYLPRPELLDGRYNLPCPEPLAR